MGRFSSESSYGHRIAAFGSGGFRISWTVDFYYSGSRQRHRGHSLGMLNWTGRFDSARSGASRCPTCVEA